jgi:hypothetical protein
MNARQVIGMAALICAWLFAGQALAEDVYRRQTIINDSNSNANDLHIEFDYRANGATVRPKDQAAGHDGDGACSGAPYGRIIDFAPPDSFGTVGAGGVAYLDYNYPGAVGSVDVDAASSYFTLDGNALPGFTLNGRSMAITRYTYYADTQVTITNSAQAPVTYQNVQLFKNNLLTNWSMDTYFTPTGDAFPGQPLTFTLNPGEAMVMDIGPTTDYTYVLVMMESRPSGSDPSVEWAVDYLGARSGPPSAKLTYDCVTGRLVMDTGDNTLNGFIIHSQSDDFTTLAVPPPGFKFNTNKFEMIASQLGAVLEGSHDFGPNAVDRGMLWNAAEGRWDADEWTFTYTVDGVASTFYGDIELAGELPGDTNRDGVIDAWDIQRILAANSYGNGTIGWSWEQGDFNGDGLVDGTDIEMILDHGQYDSQQEMLLMAMVPEPATLALMAGGAIALLRRRRK